MEILTWLTVVNDLLMTPFALLFFAVGILLTFRFGFLQFRALPRFFELVSGGVKERHKYDESKIGSFQALFTAMAGTIGMGNVVGPSIAVFLGGPGALFWLLIYIFFGSVTKLAEVVLAMHTRERLPDGHIVGGPMQYLKKVHPYLGYWYMSIVSFLFVVWSGLQSNTLGQIFETDGIVPSWVVGLGLAFLVYLVVKGGIHRIGAVATGLVPLMFVLYVSFALLILFRDISALRNAFYLIASNIFTPAAPVGMFMGASVMTAMKWGVYRSIHITEAGLGSSSIAHAMSDTANPLDQGILAMISMLADAILSTLSGLLVLVSGIWMQGVFRSTLVYEAFKMNSPYSFGVVVLIMSVSLFVITTVIGNTFNGMQAFASFTRDRYMNAYLAITLITIMCGSMIDPRTAWSITDIMLTLVVIPNIIGVTVLAFRHPAYFKLEHKVR